MKLTDKIKRLMICLLAGIMVFSGTFVYNADTAFAEEAGEEGEGEAAEGEGNPEEGEGENSEGEGEGEAEGELTPEEAQAALEVVTPSSIPTNIDGKYLALTFPASEVPKGFSVITVDYEGEKVMLAQMTSKSATIGASGLTVSLAYLTDENGGNGEFYICDTTEGAKMSDMIKINGAEDKYIIVLDPGDNVVGPPGFVQHKLQWGSKTAVAWSLPEDTVEEEGEGPATGEATETEGFLTTKVYAAELNLSAGAAAADSFSAGAGAVAGPEALEDDDPKDEGSKDDGPKDDSEEKKKSDEEEKADDDAMVALDAIAHTNASGLIQAQPKDFCLLYAIDESANLGFYLYDIDRQTYQRYVDIPKGESATLVKYRKQSRNRLFIIIVMIIVLIIMLIILINTLVSRKDNEAYDEDGENPEEEAMRKRAKDKERRNIGKRERAYLLDEESDDDFEDDYEDEDEDEEDDDYEDEDEEEDEEEEEEKPSRNKSYIRRRSVTQGHELPQKRGTIDVPEEVNRAETEVDWENMEITAGLNPKKTREAMKGGSKSKEPAFDLDEDFDFEFLNIRK